MNCPTNLYHKLILLMVSSKRHMLAVAEKHNMTPVQGMMLMLFEPGRGSSMQKLSTLMGCDASNTTGLVDKLEIHGLVERTADPSDRRVKLVQLTSKGLGYREEILTTLARTEAVDLQILTDEERINLGKIIDKLLAAQT